MKLFGDEHPNLAGWMTRASERPSLKRAFEELTAAVDRLQNETDPFFDHDRLHWRNDRIEMALRAGLGPWLLEELGADRAFLPPVP